MPMAGLLGLNQSQMQPVLGSPPYNSNGNSPWGNGFQDQGPTYTCPNPPNCENDIPALPAEVVNIQAHYSKFELALWRLQQRVGVVDNFLMGIVGEINPVIPYINRWGARRSEQMLGYNVLPFNEGSSAYRAGGWTGFAATIVIPGGGEEEAAVVGLERTVQMSAHAADQNINAERTRMDDGLFED